MYNVHGISIYTHTRIYTHTYIHTYLHCIALHYIHTYIPYHYIPLHYITLHCMHPSIHTYIHTHTHLSIYNRFTVDVYHQRLTGSPLKGYLKLPALHDPFLGPTSNKWLLNDAVPVESGHQYGFV